MGHQGHRGLACEGPVHLSHVLWSGETSQTCRTPPPPPGPELRSRDLDCRDHLHAEMAAFMQNSSEKSEQHIVPFQKHPSIFFLSTRQCKSTCSQRYKRRGEGRRRYECWTGPERSPEKRVWRILWQRNVTMMIPCCCTRWWVCMKNRTKQLKRFVAWSSELERLLNVLRTDGSVVKKLFQAFFFCCWPWMQKWIYIT